MIIFGSVRFLSKKNNQTEIFFLKKNRNRVKPTGVGSVFFGKKPVQTSLARFFPVWLGFGSVWLGFFPFFCRFQFGSVFLVFSYKTETEPNRTGRLFQKFNRFNRFFFYLVFLIIFFYLLDLIGFSVFFAYLYTIYSDSDLMENEIQVCLNCRL